MKIRKLLVLFLAVVGSTALFAKGGSEKGQPQAQEGSRPESTVNPGEVVGFEEFPLGEDFELGPLNVAGVYFQPVDMEPAGAGLAASEADMHIEADISALEGNNLGYGAGDFVPYLTVDYEITKSTGYRIEGTFMPMNASDGPHYGANIKLDGPGDYTVRFVIKNPESLGYVLHVDNVTGVPGRFWSAPLVAEWNVSYVGPSW